MPNTCYLYYLMQSQCDGCCELLSQWCKLFLFTHYQNRNYKSRLTTLQEVQEWIDERLIRPDYDGFLAELLPIENPVAPSNAEREGRQSIREVIGVLGSTAVPNIGYIFHPGYYGKGYATEALKAYMESYWDRVPPLSSGKAGSYDYASARTDVENLPSRRLLERCGFKFHRINEKCIDAPMMGGLRDDALYVIPRPGTDVNQIRISDVNPSGRHDERISTR